MSPFFFLIPETSKTLQSYEIFLIFVAIFRKNLQDLTVQASNTIGGRQAKEFFRPISRMLGQIISLLVNLVWQSFSLRSRKLRKTEQKALGKANK